MNKGTSKGEKAQEGRALENQCWTYLKPLLEELHKKVDRWLVKTLLVLVLAILLHRNPKSGLLLSELGDHLLSSGRSPTGGNGLRVCYIPSDGKVSGLSITFGMKVCWKRGRV